MITASARKELRWKFFRGVIPQKKYEKITSIWILNVDSMQRNKLLVFKSTVIKMGTQMYQLPLVFYHVKTWIRFYLYIFQHFSMMEFYNGEAFISTYVCFNISPWWSFITGSIHFYMHNCDNAHGGRFSLTKYLIVRTKT